MLKSTYKYTCPTEYGFTKLTMSTQEYETLIGRKARNKKTMNREVYAKKMPQGDTEYEIHYMVKTYIKILTTLAFPFLVLMNGLNRTSEISKEIKEMWNQKESGNFTSDSFRK